MCKHIGCEGCTPDACPKTAKCQAYTRCYNKEYREKHKEEHDAYNRDWQKNNLSWRREYLHEWCENNPDKKREYDRRWRESHRDEIAAKEHRYHQETYVPVGTHKIYLSYDGSMLYMKSMSEVFLASIFDDDGVDFKYEHRKFDTPYGTYRPDFYIPKWNAYIEVKAPHWMKMCPEQQIKRDYLRNNGVRIYMIDANMINTTW